VKEFIAELTCKLNKNTRNYAMVQSTLETVTVKCFQKAINV